MCLRFAFESLCWGIENKTKSIRETPGPETKQKTFPIQKENSALQVRTITQIHHWSGFYSFKTNMWRLFVFANFMKSYRKKKFF